MRALICNLVLAKKEPQKRTNFRGYPKLLKIKELWTMSEISYVSNLQDEHNASSFYHMYHGKASSQS